MLVRSDSVLGRVVKAARTGEPWLRLTVSPRVARFLIAAGARAAPTLGYSGDIRSDHVRRELRKRWAARKILYVVDDLANLTYEVERADVDDRGILIHQFSIRFNEASPEIRQLLKWLDVPDLAIEVGATFRSVHKLLRHKDAAYDFILVERNMTLLFDKLRREVRASYEPVNLNFAGVFLGDLPIEIADLDGAIWDRLTVWPSRELAEQVQARSDEFKQGLYQVRLGAEDHVGAR